MFASIWVCVWCIWICVCVCVYMMKIFFPGEMDEERDVMRVPSCVSNRQLMLEPKEARSLLSWDLTMFSFAPKLQLKTKSCLTGERQIAIRKNKLGSFLQFCAGFTNTCHVNEVGAISLVPGACERKTEGSYFSRQIPSSSIASLLWWNRIALSSCICLRILHVSSAI